MIKTWERTYKKERDGEIGEHKWNGSTEYEIEKVKLEKVKDYHIVQLFLNMTAH